MGTSVLLAVLDGDGPQLYLVEPSGTALVSAPDPEPSYLNGTIGEPEHAACSCKA